MECEIESTLPLCKKISYRQQLHERVDTLLKNSRRTHSRPSFPSFPSFPQLLSQLIQRIWNSGESCINEVVKEHFIILEYEYLKSFDPPAMEMFREEFLDTENGDFYENNCWLLRRHYVTGEDPMEAEKNPPLECLRVGVTKNVDLLMYQEYQSAVVKIDESLFSVPLVVKASFTTTRYKFSPYLYFDVIQLGSNYYVVGTVKGDNRPEYKPVEGIDDWLPANSKVVEFICYCRNNPKEKTPWPAAIHEQTYTSQEGLAAFYRKEDPLLPLSKEFGEFITALADICPDYDEESSKKYLLEFIHDAYEAKSCWWKDMQLLLSHFDFLYKDDPRARRNKRKDGKAVSQER